MMNENEETEGEDLEIKREDMSYYIRRVMLIL